VNAAAEDTERLRLAAEDAAWMVARGYPSAESSDFIARHRALSPHERSLLAKSAEASAHVKHHIARELDPEDVARRPLRIDTASIVAVVAAAMRGSPLLESMAGVLIDPTWSRTDAPPAELRESLARVVRAAAELRPKSVTWLIEDGVVSSDAYATALREHSKVGRAPSEVEKVEHVAGRLAGAGFVASSDVAILDGCGTWLNLAALAVADLSEAQRIRLHDG
jgi:hypothetical protein